ncbi:Tn3 family transposase [Nonomuraea angiospora]|uniref:Tn3 family transposase n=1 Tax=Nonomuraea angiospora TaxID=46172 RepID=UPI0037B08E7B
MSFKLEHLADEELRTEINEGLNVVENFNSAGNDLFYGKAGDLTGDDHENVEISALALHLIAAAITYLDTHLIQIMLRDRAWRKRRLTALFWSI